MIRNELAPGPELEIVWIFWYQPNFVWVKRVVLTNLTEFPISSSYRTYPPDRIWIAMHAIVTNTKTICGFSL